jgi:uncharacterized protein (UPF0276 family)
MPPTNRWNLPDLGIGVALRNKHYPHILSKWPEVAWFEILSENYMHTAGRPLWILDQIAERYPLVLHGVSLGIGGSDPIDWDFLAELKRLAQRTKAVWMGDHVCWTGVAGQNNHDLLPVPYDERTLQHLVERVRIVQDYLERPLVLENPSTYLEFEQSTLREEEFIRRLADDSDCALLLDVNNIYVSSRNHGFDPYAYLDHVPWQRVVQIHMAGHTDHGTHCIDTHMGHVRQEVWELYAEALRRGGVKPTLLEWDQDIPDFETTHAEALKALEYQPRQTSAAETTSATSARLATRPTVAPAATFTPAATAARTAREGSG